MNNNLDIIIPVYNEHGNILKTLSEIIKIKNIKQKKFLIKFQKNLINHLNKIKQ